MLSIPESLLLLALNEKNGTFQKKFLSPGLTGGLLIELAMAGRLGVDEKKRLVLKDDTPVKKELLDLAISRIKAEPPKDVRRWTVTLMSLGGKSIEAHLVEMLVKKGILRVDETKSLGIFKARKYQVTDTAARDELRARLRAAALGEKEPDPRSAAILILMVQCELPRLVLRGEEETVFRQALGKMPAVFDRARSVAARPVIVQVFKAVEASKESYSGV